MTEERSNRVAVARPGRRLAVLALAAWALGACGGSSSSSASAAEDPATGTMTIAGDVELALTLARGQAGPEPVQVDSYQMRLVFRSQDPERPRVTLDFDDLPADLAPGTYPLGQGDVSADLHISPPDPAGSSERFSPREGALVIEAVDGDKLSGSLSAGAKENNFAPRDERRNITIEAAFEGVQVKR